jgi:hypothetical protein
MPIVMETPLPGEVRRELHTYYTLIEDSPRGLNTKGTVYIELACVGKCERPYRLDEHHPEYARIKEALDRGDRSVIRCYHGRHHGRLD